MKKIIYLITTFVFTFLFVYSNAYAEEQMRYDITDLTISNNIMTVKGWAVIKDVDMGKNTGTKEKPVHEYSPEYRMKIVSNKDNSTPDGTKIYYTENPSNFSVTCPLFFGTCYSHYQTGGYTYRNDKIKDSAKFYDNVDFKFEFDLSSLNSADEYHLELQIKAGNYESNWKTLSVLKDSIHNNNKINYKVTDNLNSVKMLATGALVQKSDIKSSPDSGGHAVDASNRFWFKQGAIYELAEAPLKDEKNFQNSHATYRYYYLKLNKNEPRYQNKYGEKGWAYSAWIEANSNFVFTIQKIDKCTDYKYAKDNPNECCNHNKEIHYPEACCGVKEYVESSKFDVNKNWQNALCCKSSDNFENTYDDGTTISYNTFYGAKKHISPNDFLINAINDKCASIYTTASKSCSKDTSEISDSTHYSMSYVRVNRTKDELFDSWIEKENTYETTIKLSKKPEKTLTKDDVAYSYFNKNDYSSYIKQKNNSKISKTNLFTNISDSDYVLNNNQFTFTINSLRKIKDTEYKISITVKVNDKMIPTQKPFNHSTIGNEGVYFLPVKIWLCDKKTSGEPSGGSSLGKSANCDNSSYFKKYTAYCCTIPKHSSKAACTTPTNLPKTKWTDSTGLTCGKTPPSSPIVTTKNTVYNDPSNSFSISCEDSIYLSDYQTLDDMKSIQFKIGTGFYYDITVKSNIKCSVNYTLGKVYSSYSSVSNTINSANDQLSRISNTNNYEDIIKNQEIIMENNTTDKYVVDNSTIKKSTDSKNLKNKVFLYVISTTCARPGGGTYPCNTVTSDNFSYNESIEYQYEYKINLKQKYISKSDATKIVTTDESSNGEYVDGGTKYYITRNNTKTSGIYDFKVKFNKMGFTQAGSSTFTCQYLTYDHTGGVKITTDPTTGDPIISTTPGATGYYFRPISLSNPFPNSREIGDNWVGNSIIDTTNTKIDKYIISNKDTVYTKKPMYEITLDSSLINAIKKYNSEQNSNGGYLNWNNMSFGKCDEYNQTSKFIDYISGKTSTNTVTNYGDSNYYNEKNTLSTEKGHNKIKVDNHNERDDKKGEFIE